jgi:hypothetical protein
VRSDVAAILFDEPLTVMDPQIKWQLRSQLKKLHREFDFTMIYVTHDQTEALTFADKVVVMYEGEVVQIGTPEELFERPEHTFVGYFIGSPGMNLAAAEVSGNKALVAGHHRAAGRIQPRPQRAGSRSACGPSSSRSAARGPARSAFSGSRISAGSRSSRCALGDIDLNVIAEEADPDPGRDVRIRFDRSRINVYADGRIVEGGRPDPWTRPGTTRPGSGAAGAAAGGVQRRHPADDGGQLFGPGDLRRQRVLLRGREVVRGGAGSERFHCRARRQLTFTGIILLIEIPLGVAIALTMPRKGPGCRCAWC